ncbi:MAG TPA: ABC transporter ATP-binding protein [Vicinamibacterales bacterium]|nr:ABC transporter ATP-binding protein [Vicinamibacterales bacterium]
MPNSSDVVIRAEHLSKRFMLRHDRTGSIKDAFLAAAGRRRRERVEEFWALRDASFEVRKGEALALVGRNGSGKSTLLKLIAGIHVPTSGRLSIARSARIGTMIELGIGFHGDLTAKENVYLNASIYGLLRAEIDDIYPRIVEYSGLANFMDVPIRNFSSGMNMRLGFSVAAHLKPDMLLIDEVFAVGDADFQRRCLETMAEVRERGCTVLFVSHSAPAVQAICERACLLEAGRLVFDGSVDDALGQYAELIEDREDAALPGSEARAAPPEEVVVEEPEDLDDRPHRKLMGGAWSELGAWALDFLMTRGLQPHEHVLDLGCGSLPVTIAMLPAMAPGAYWGFEPNRGAFEDGVRIELPNAGLRPELGHFIVNRHFDLSECPHPFAFALAHSLAHRVPAEDFGRAVAATVGHLLPNGQLFLAVPSDLTEHLAVLTRVAATIDVSVEPVDRAGHPRGEPVYRVVRKTR